MYEFKLPDLGEGIHEGEVLKWHVEQGGTVVEDEPLVDVETDKAAVTIPSPRGGKVVQLNGGVGDIVEVGNIIAVIDDGSAGSASPAPSASAAVPKTMPDQPVPQSLHAGIAAQVTQEQADVPVPSGLPGRKAIAAPATRRIARERGIDINQVAGSGKGGRVTPEDLDAFASGGARVPAGAGAGGGAHSAPTEPIPPKWEGGGGGSPIPLLDIEALPDFSRFGPVEKEPLRSIRRKVARRMVTSMIMAPHVCHMDEVDVTDLEALRRSAREDLKAEGHPAAKLTSLAFIVKAVASQLLLHPMYNASLDAVREEIIYKKYYGIGIAVDTGSGLVVPVLRDPDKKSILQIAVDINDLATRGRNGQLDASEFQGGTFTITNMGALGGTNMIPCINYPEVAILGVARSQEKPVVRNGEIAIRTIMPLTLAFDHRIADGANAASFVGGLVRQLSNPGRMLLES